MVSGMVCPTSSQILQPPPPLCEPVPGLLVGWLLVFGLLGWLLGLLVGCWWMGSSTAEFGWLVGRLVVCMVGCLLASCWGVCTGAVAFKMVLGGVYVCVCCLDTCYVVLLHSVPVCKHVCAMIAKVMRGGGVVHISFWRSLATF